MIERKFVAARIKEFQIQEYVDQSLSNVGHSFTKMQRTPLGEKIIIYAARPGLIVGRKGENIKKLTKNLKKRFNLENPHIEISEVENIFLDANIVAEKIASTLERFGPQRFKGVGHKTIQNVMAEGARGIEILISGKIPGSRAKTWRFYRGYLKKCGDVAKTAVQTAHATAILKSGSIGIRVKIMSADFRMPDDIQIKEEDIQEEKKETKKEEKKEIKQEATEQKKEEKIEKKEKVKAEQKEKTEGEKETKEEKIKETKKEEKHETKEEKKEEEVKDTDKAVVGEKIPQEQEKKEE